MHNKFDLNEALEQIKAGADIDGKTSSAVVTPLLLLILK